MGNRKVVVIDDDPMIRFLIQEYLNAFGFSIETFAGGSEALPVIELSPPDLVVIDMQMPDMNGFEVLEKLRANPTTAGVATLMLSANASDGPSLSEIQPDAYLEKPFQMQGLLDAVQNTTRSNT
jgi:DNA-binding response OmpR family regulator